MVLVMAYACFAVMRNHVSSERIWSVIQTLGGYLSAFGPLWPLCNPALLTPRTLFALSCSALSLLSICLRVGSVRWHSRVHLRRELVMAIYVWLLWLSLIRAKNPKTMANGADRMWLRCAPLFFPHFIADVLWAWGFWAIGIDCFHFSFE